MVPRFVTLGSFTFLKNIIFNPATIFVMWIVLIISAFAAAFVYFLNQKIRALQHYKERLQGLYKTIGLKKPHESIKIRELYLFPVRGVCGAKVNELQLGEFGFMHDRIFVIVNPETLFPLESSTFPEVSSLR